MKRLTHLSLIISTFIILASAVDSYACTRSRAFSFEELFGSAQMIVRATAVEYAKAPGNPDVWTTGVPDSTVKFTIEEKLRGENLPEFITLNGYLSDKDDFNELPVPYKFVRRGGRSGSCFANTYKKGAQFLLFLKKTDDGIYSPNVSPLGPANEQLRSDSDAWLMWIRNYLKSSGDVSANSEATAIHIPADKRHQGLSRFDLLPFTDRRKGDPDRYRAVNPNYVKKENGNYYFVLNVKTGAHYFDENLNDKGILPDTDVEVDLTRTKKTPDNVNAKYVYVKNKGYMLASALAQSSGEIRTGRWFNFPLKDGGHLLYDGTGIERGKIAAQSVRLNYGQAKEIGGEKYYYAFSTKITVAGNNSDRPTGASGWIKASAIREGHAPQYDSAFLEKMQIPTGAGDVFTEYEITGGDPREAIGKDESGRTKYRFGYENERGEFVAYKVLPGVPLEQSVASTDYIRRSDDVVNLGFNVAGVSNDTFRVGGAGNRPLIFHRSSDKEATASIDLFYPKGTAHDSEKSAAKMIFVYGYVQTPGGKRWGWMPLGTLKPKS